MLKGQHLDLTGFTVGRSPQCPGSPSLVFNHFFIPKVAGPLNVASRNNPHQSPLPGMKRVILFSIIFAVIIARRNVSRRIPVIENPLADFLGDAKVSQLRSHSVPDGVKDGFAIEAEFFGKRAEHMPGRITVKRDADLRRRRKNERRRLVRRLKRFGEDLDGFRRQRNIVRSLVFDSPA
jgi:hypothetical protein